MDEEKTTWSWIPFVVGLMIGMIVILIIIWALYVSRVFMFTYCPKSYPNCAGGDYFNNPSDALDNGSNIDDILFIREGKLFYKRQPRTSQCVPEINQVKHIKNPQYCLFTTNDGQVFQGRSESLNSSLYNLGNGMSVITQGDCHPVTPQNFVSGIPQLKWDS